MGSVGHTGGTVITDFRTYVESLTDDEIGRVCRCAYQVVGISDPRRMWNELPEYRRTPHRTAGNEIIRSLITKFELQRTSE